MIILKGENIKKSYGKTPVLKDINISIEAGKSIAILGESGVGKTTLLHILATLEKPDSGKIYLENNILNFKNSSIRNSFFGFIFQNHNLLEDLTLFDNISIPLQIARKKKKDNTKHIEDLLKELSLFDRKDILARNLSGGEKQRASVARAFINNPKIIFADEPTGNLDGKNSKKIHALLIDFCKKRKKSLIVATHDQKLSLLCDRQFILEDGRLKIKN